MSSLLILAPIRGLKNVKNNCFINAILQAISNCDSMIEWLETADKAARLKGKLIDRVKTLLESKLGFFPVIMLIGEF